MCVHIYNKKETNYSNNIYCLNENRDYTVHSSKVLNHKVHT